MTYRCACGNRLLTAEQVGKILNPDDPLTPAAARKAMTRAGIPEARGYPADQVTDYSQGRPGKGRWGHK